MTSHRIAAVTFALLATVVSTASAPRTASAQGPPDTAAMMASQREAMASLAFLDGVWRGEAWTLLPSGEKHTVTQTERVGSFLGGAVKVIEGRGYQADGTTSFNAFAIVSFDPGKKTYSMRSYAMGRAGDYAFMPSAGGFVWEIPAGPATIRYTAVVKDGKWSEVGDRIVPGKEPARFFEMNLQRVGDTDWPAGGAIGPK